MGRPPGSRNADYDSKRRELAKKVAQTLVAAPADHTSLRELARAAEVSVSTMRHYFDDRNGLVDAALAEMGGAAQRHLENAVTELDGEPTERLVVWLGVLKDAWTSYSVGRAHAVGLAEGLYADAGPSYVQHLYRPFLDSTEQVLRDLDADGFVSIANHRRAAHVLLTPLKGLLTYQESLRDPDHGTVDVDDFVADHVSRFLRGWVDLN